jgi:hypothetical protein
VEGVNSVKYIQYIVRTFANTPMYPTQHNNNKKEGKNKINA